METSIGDHSDQRNCGCYKEPERRRPRPGVIDIKLTEETDGNGVGIDMARWAGFRAEMYHTEEGSLLSPSHKLRYIPQSGFPSDKGRRALLSSARKAETLGLVA